MGQAVVPRRTRPEPQRYPIRVEHGRSTVPSTFCRMPDQPAHMTPEEFRRQGHAAIDWIADYWASLDDLPVRSQVAAR